MWRGGTNGEAELLASCYRNSLMLASEHGARTVAFPSISTGIYGYPIELAAGVVIETVRDTLKQPSGIQEVLFCCFSDDDLAVYEKGLTKRVS